MLIESNYRDKEYTYTVGYQVDVGDSQELDFQSVVYPYILAELDKVFPDPDSRSAGIVLEEFANRVSDEFTGRFFIEHTLTYAVGSVLPQLNFKVLGRTVVFVSVTEEDDLYAD